MPAPHQDEGGTTPSGGNMCKTICNQKPSEWKEVLAAAKLVENIGAKVVGFAFLIELAHLGGRKALEPFQAPIKTILTYER